VSKKGLEETSDSGRSNCQPSGGTNGDGKPLHTNAMLQHIANTTRSETLVVGATEEEAHVAGATTIAIARAEKYYALMQTQGDHQRGHSKERLRKYDIATGIQRSISTNGALVRRPKQEWIRTPKG
jgi:hypothetical protein